MPVLSTSAAAWRRADVPAKTPLTVRIARWSATHPWRAIGGWVLFVALCLVAGGQAGTKSADPNDGRYEAAHAYSIYKDGGFESGAAENVIVTAASGTIGTAQLRAAADEVAARWRALPEVESVDSVQTNRSGSAALVSATMRGKSETGPDHIGPLLAASSAVAKAHPELRVEQAGDASVGKAINDAVAKDLSKSERTSVPITLAILLVAFGALFAAGVPVALGLSAVAAAFGLSALASHVIPAADSVNNVIMLIGLAVGVDYSLFYLRREREERAAGRDHHDAIEIAAATSGHAVVVSALAVIIAMTGLLLVGDGTFSSMGAGCIIVVAVAMLGSITALPAVLAKLGRFVDRPRVPLVWRLTARRTNGQPRVWRAILRPVLRRPKLSLAVSGLALLALAAPVATMKLSLTDINDLPQSIPAVAAYQRIAAEFPSQGSTLTVVAKGTPADTQRIRASLTELSRRTSNDPNFTPVDTPDLRTSPDGRISVLTVPVASEDRAVQHKSLKVLRGALVPATVGQLPGVWSGVTGAAAFDRDFVNQVRERMPMVVGFILALTFLIMLLSFRSVVIAGTTILLNLLSAGASFGLLVLVFQHSWANGLLDYHSNGAVVTWLPLMMFVILFGLSMDYHVFVVSRIREAAMRGMTTRDAVADGIARSAGTVTSAAAVMVAAFAIFATLSLMEMKQLGVGLASAILIDATIIRAVVLPSAMAVLGRWNWWAPNWLRRRGELVEPDTYDDVRDVRTPAPVA